MPESEAIQNLMKNQRPNWPNMAAEAAKDPSTTDGWPWVTPWPRDKGYVANSWMDRETIDAAFAGWKKGDPLGYIKDQAPAFSLPSYKGQRYETMVPDTLDIQERAVLGILQ